MDKREQLHELVQSIEVSCFMLCDAARIYDDKLGILGGGWDILHGTSLSGATLEPDIAFRANFPPELTGEDLHGIFQLNVHPPPDISAEEREQWALMPHRMQSRSFSWKIGHEEAPPEFVAFSDTWNTVAMVFNGFRFMVPTTGAYELQFILERAHIASARFVVRLDSDTLDE